MDISLEVGFRDITYKGKNLCFRHAVMWANEGHHIEVSAEEEHSACDICYRNEEKEEFVKEHLNTEIWFHSRQDFVSYYSALYEWNNKNGYKCNRIINAETLDEVVSGIEEFEKRRIDGKLLNY